MTTPVPLHPIAAAGHLYDGGFRYGQGLVVMLAIGWAESDLRPWIRGPINEDGTVGNTDGSVDRGWLQINSRWHAEVTDACAFDPACAAREAFRISSRGTKFSQWAAYLSGSHRKHMPAARYAVALYHLLERGASNERVADIATYRKEPA